MSDLYNSKIELDLRFRGCCRQVGTDDIAEDMFGSLQQSLLLFAPSDTFCRASIVRAISRISTNVSMIAREVCVARR